MKTVVLFGATGNLGKRLAVELTCAGYQVTAITRNPERAPYLKKIVACVKKADVLKGNWSCLCQADIVVSALGKSVSISDKGKESFFEVDLVGNRRILNDAQSCGVKKFVYISAFQAERFQKLAYFKAHHQFETELIASGLNYTILKPPALFSAFDDLAMLAREGSLFNLGDGNTKTNPIDENDLARICVAALKQTNNVLEAGGMEVLTRRQINELIQEVVRPGKKLRSVPPGLINISLPIVKLASKNLYDKLAFFKAVCSEDMVAPKLGTSRLKEYLTKKFNLVS